MPGLGFQQYTEHANCAQAQAVRGMSAFAFIQEGQVSVQLDGQGNSFGLTQVEVALKRNHQCAILNWMAMNPSRLLNLRGARPALTKRI